MTREDYPALFAALDAMTTRSVSTPFRLPDHRYGRPPTRRERMRERAVYTVLVGCVLVERARRLWVHLTIAAIGLAALGGIALIASRPGG